MYSAAIAAWTPRAVRRALCPKPGNTFKPTDRMERTDPTDRTERLSGRMHLRRPTPGGRERM
eukprot:6272337-Pyramimonas_sp.AAC.1